MFYVDGADGNGEVWLRGRRDGGGEFDRATGGLDGDDLAFGGQVGVVEGEVLSAARVGAGEAFAGHGALRAVDDEEVVGALKDEGVSGLRRRCGGGIDRIRYPCRDKSHVAIEERDDETGGGGIAMDRSVDIGF